jgi:hypothetical protein
VKRSLENQQNVPSPDGYGWKVSDGNISVTWMLKKPAPDEILNLISCSCKKSKCKTKVCICLQHRVDCTDLCDCLKCENSSSNSSSEYDSDDDSLSEFEDFNGESSASDSDIDEG